MLVEKWFEGAFCRENPTPTEEVSFQTFMKKSPILLSGKELFPPSERPKKQKKKKRKKSKKKEGKTAAQTERGSNSSRISYSL